MLAFKRKIEEEMNCWFEESKGGSALLIEGARRVGKTTICEEFGRKHFGQFLIVDFSSAPEDVLSLFDSLNNLEEFFQKLFFFLNVKPLPKGSLIVFDEIQHCPKARQRLKQLVKDGRYYYIETGSLVSIRENTASIQIPSEEYPIQMFPMDYEEFLWAVGKEEEAQMIRGLYEKRQTPDPNLHKRLLNTFFYYLSIGGMPSVVAAYLETKDIAAAERKKKEIIALYQNDLRKLDDKYGTQTKRIFDLLPLIASRQTFTMPLTLFGIDPRTSAFSNNMDKIEESKIFGVVHETDVIEIAHSAGIDVTRFKLYYSDVGLALCHAYTKDPNDVRPFYKKLIQGELRTNLGYIMEGAILQMLSASGKKLFYTSWSEEIEKPDGTTYLAYFEVDFLYGKYGKTQPVEVKTGRQRSVASAIKLRTKHGDFVRKPILICERPFIDFEDRTEIPYYMTFCL